MDETSGVKISHRCGGIICEGKFSGPADPHVVVPQ